MRSLESSIATLTGNVTPQVQAYRDEMRSLIGKLDEWSDPVMPTNEDEYRKLSAIRSAITELSCFTFNNNQPENDRVWKLESVYGALQARYNRRLLCKHGADHSLARYLLSRSYFTRFARATCLLEARDRGLLRRGDGKRNPASALFVIGLQCKVGDNVFTVDDKNRHYRQYVGHIGRQALGVVQSVPFEGEKLAVFLASVPVLEPEFHPVWVGDGKGMARPPILRRAEQMRVFQLLEASPHELSPRLTALPVVAPVAPSPLPSPIDSRAQQGVLFEAAA